MTSDSELQAALDAAYQRIFSPKDRAEYDSASSAYCAAKAELRKREREAPSFVRDWLLTDTTK